MTVCIAAISQGGILGASDRMLTAADVEFEPERMKIYQLSNSIVAMTAGDASLHSEIIRDVFVAVEQRIKSDASQWVRIKDVAELYVSYWNAIKRKRSESQFLAPLGLTHETFLEKQHLMMESLVLKITDGLIYYDLPDISAIITGVDTDGGPHIYVVHNNEITCHDTIGFASIGIGARHALSQFMMGGHTVSKLPYDTLLLTYIAKKRAEVAPGVGSGTDMFVVTTLGGFAPFTSKPLFDKLEKTYNRIKRGEANAMKGAKDTLSKYLNQSELKQGGVQKRAEQAPDDAVVVDVERPAD